MTRAADLLRDYLADRDIPCERCRFNLRGCTSVQCPECGQVIPRPPADFVARTAADPASLRLFCEDCGYTLSGANPLKCPECGSTSLARYSTEKPPFRPKRRFPPLIVVILAAAGALAFVTCLAEALANANRPAAARSLTATPRIGAALSLIPIIIAGVWMLTRGLIARLQPGERAGLAIIASLFSLIAFIAALRTLT